MHSVSQTALKLESAYNAVLPHHTIADLKSARFVFVSDLHRGIGNGADDAARCTRVLAPALRHYLEHGFTLAILGDAEELWEVPEQKWNQIFQVHARSYAVEREFAREGRYLRVYGNHDFAWSQPDDVARHLAPVLGIGEVPEAVRITFTDAGQPVGEVHLVHGHQGELLSDSLRNIATTAVRHVWANFQNLTRKRSTHYRDSTHAEGRDAEIFYDWCVTKRQVISIMGHTHRTVFERFNDPEHARRLADQADRFRARAANVFQPDLRQHLERQAQAWNDRYTRAIVSRSDPKVCKSAFFNTGCCCFSNEFISAIEIEDGEIRLAVWTPPRDTPVRRVVQQAPLQSVFAQLEDEVPNGYWNQVRLVAFED